MVSLLRSLLVAGLVLLLAGVASGGWGVYQQVTDTCESGHGLTITQLEENETADPTVEHVEYSNLSATEQRVFQEILTAETTPIYQNSSMLEGLTRKIVMYRGERYKTSGMFVSDCARAWRVKKTVGGLTAFLGGVIVVATSGWRRFR